MKKHKWVLDENWKCAWTYISTNCMALALAIQGAWMYIPDDLKKEAPHGIVAPITIGLLFLGIIGRLVKKEPCDANKGNSNSVRHSKRPSSNRSMEGKRVAKRLPGTAKRKNRPY